ncbi:MAG: hypothetical protein PF517_18375 [Salinivirgaceae bacterium]|jgi:gliding motility-associated lipoprotein GldH|nr:hypothetical protein [Salinivirgaceae bacterium]
MNKIFAIVFVFISLIACQPKNRVYVKHKDLSSNLEWLKKDVREFKVPIDDTISAYNLSLSFRYAQGFQHKVAQVLVTEISPSGAESKNEFELKVRNDNGEYIGEPGYDIWDSEHIVVPNKIYSETGVFTYKIEHNMPNDPLNLAMEIGVILDKVE